MKNLKALPRRATIEEEAEMVAKRRMVLKVLPTSNSQGHSLMIEEGYLALVTMRKEDTISRWRNGTTEEDTDLHRVEDQEEVAVVLVLNEEVEIQGTTTEDMAISKEKIQEDTLLGSMSSVVLQEMIDQDSQKEEEVHPMSMTNADLSEALLAA